MTDMRATERLLEVIYEALIRAGYNNQTLAVGGHPLKDLQGAIIELRRRGDTLVRAADLQRILDIANGHRDEDSWCVAGNAKLEAEFAAEGQAIDRLENALGGKMR